MARKPVGGKPTHPGEILREDILPALGRPKAEIARALGVSRRQLYNLLDGEDAVSASMALRLGRLLGSRPAFWLDLQATYDLAVAEEKFAKELAAIPQLHVAADVDEPQVLEDATAGPPRQEPADKARVSIGEPWEVTYWSKAFEVSPAQLRRAFETARGNAGVPVTAVARILGKKVP